jgi:hypothetical protein
VFAIDAVEIHFALKRIAMNAQIFGSQRLIVIVSSQYGLDHTFFQNLDSLSEKEVGLQKLFNKCVKLIDHASGIPYLAVSATLFLAFCSHARPSWKLCFNSMGASETAIREASVKTGAICEFTTAAGAAE